MTNQVPLVSPIKGVVRAVSREGQPPETCWDAQNVLPYDRYGRKRLAQRGGLLKQYPNQMSANFVQGMIEAPNIIYPPGMLGMDTPIINDLMDPFTFPSSGGNVGPLSFMYPIFPLQTYEWDFTIAYNVVATTTGDPWFIGNEDILVFYWPLDPTTGNDLILKIELSYLLGDFGSGFSLDAVMQAYTGDHANSGSWSGIAGLSGGSALSLIVGASSGDMTGTLTAACTIQIHTDGTINLTMAGATNSPGVGTSPITQTLWPQLKLLSITFQNSPGSNSTAVSAISVTD